MNLLATAFAISTLGQKMKAFLAPTSFHASNGSSARSDPRK